MTASLEKDDRLQMGFKRPSREVQLIELAVFLLLIVPSMAASFFILSQEHPRFMAEAILAIFNDLALLSLVLYFIWRNEEPIQHVGWTFNNFRKEIAWGLILFCQFTSVPICWKVPCTQSGFLRQRNCRLFWL